MKRLNKDLIEGWQAALDRDGQVTVPAHLGRLLVAAVCCVGICVMLAVLPGVAGGYRVGAAVLGVILLALSSRLARWRHACEHCSVTVSEAGLRAFHRDVPWHEMLGFRLQSVGRRIQVFAVMERGWEDQQLSDPRWGVRASARLALIVYHDSGLLLPSVGHPRELCAWLTAELSRRRAVDSAVGPHRADG